MKSLSIFKIMFFMQIINAIFPDGPPINGNDFYDESIALELTKPQIEEASSKRLVTITEDQKHTLKEYTKAKIPTKIKIITYPYNDCSCELFWYGLWSKDNEIKILKNELKSMESSRRALLINDYEVEPDDFSINISPYGDIFYNFIKYTNFTKLAQVLKKLNKEYIFIQTPPLSNEKKINEIYKIVLNIVDILGKEGIRTSAYFIPSKKYEQIYDSLTKIQSKLSHFSDHKEEKLLYDFNVSSFLKENKRNYSVKNIDDNNMNTAWVEGVPGHGFGEKIVAYFKNDNFKPLKYIYIVNGYAKSKDLFLKNSRVKDFLLMVDGEPKYIISLKDTMVPQWIDLSQYDIRDSEYLELKILDIYGGWKYQDTAISELSLF